MEKEKKDRAVAFIDFTRKAGLVKRFHTMETVVLDRVSSHTFGVLNLVYILSDRNPSVKLMKAALFHDVTECLLGDVPTNIKVKYPQIGTGIKEAELEVMKTNDIIDYELNAEDAQFLKVADILEGMYFATEEIERGNFDLFRAFTVYYNKYNSLPYANAGQLECQMVQLLVKRVQSRMKGYKSVNLR